MRKKITVIGGGFVGEHVAMGCAMQELGDVVLLDILEGPPQGKGSISSRRRRSRGSTAMVRGTNSYDDTGGLGHRRDHGRRRAQARDEPGRPPEHQHEHREAVRREGEGQLAQGDPDPRVSNPLDVMAYVAKVVTGFPKERVMGMAGVLDTARYRAFIAMELSVSVESVTALVLGGHGDSMVPLPSLTMVGGIPLTELLPQEQDRRDREAHRRRRRRDRVAPQDRLRLLRAGRPPRSRWWTSILQDKKKVLPCAAYLEGSTGSRAASSGVPVQLGSAGIEQILRGRACSPTSWRALTASARRGQGATG